MTDDHSRVILEKNPTESDYINANYIEVSQASSLLHTNEKSIVHELLIASH